MDVARDHLFAGARLAENQHVGIVGSDLLDQAVNRAHGRRLTARPEPEGARLRGMAVAHVLRLVEDRR